jgi:MFS family permease
LFANPATDKPYHQEEIQKKHIKPAAKAAGITTTVGWKTFRHSFRSWLDQTEAAIGVQRELMRHASIQTTMNVLRQGNDGRKTAGTIPSAALGSLGVFSYFALDYKVAIALVAIALFGHQSWSANLHTAISEISPPEHAAVLYGMTGAAGTLMGAAMQLVIGPVVDAAGYRSVFIGAGLTYVVAAVLLLAAGRIEQIRPPLVAGPPKLAIRGATGDHIA